jgi:hypothetical protein
VLRLLRLILATWRITSLLVQEAGPYHIFARLRDQHRDNEFGKALQCIWCTSVWVAVLMVILDRYCPVLVDIFAVSTGAILVDKEATEITTDS